MNSIIHFLQRVNWDRLLWGEHLRADKQAVDELFNQVKSIGSSEATLTESSVVNKGTKHEYPTYKIIIPMPTPLAAFRANRAWLERVAVEPREFGDPLHSAIIPVDNILAMGGSFSDIPSLVIYVQGSLSVKNTRKLGGLLTELKDKFAEIIKTETQPLYVDFYEKMTEYSNADEAGRQKIAKEYIPPLMLKLENLPENEQNYARENFSYFLRGVAQHNVMLSEEIHILNLFFGCYSKEKSSLDLNDYEILHGTSESCPPRSFACRYGFEDSLNMLNHSNNEFNPDSLNLLLGVAVKLSKIPARKEDAIKIAEVVLDKSLAGALVGDLNPMHKACELLDVLKPIKYTVKKLSEGKDGARFEVRFSSQDFLELPKINQRLQHNMVAQFGDKISFQRTANAGFFFISTMDKDTANTLERSSGVEMGVTIR